MTRPSPLFATQHNALPLAAPGDSSAEWETLEELDTLDPDELFARAAAIGATRDAYALAQSGLASPETILEYARRSRYCGLWTALAAHSAAARGDFPRAVQLASEAARAATVDIGLVDLEICRVAAVLDERHRALLVADYLGC